MKDVAYLAWRYVSYHRLKTSVLIASIAIIIYLPLGLNVLINQSSIQLSSRAEATPLLIGAKGSPLELVLRSLYFAAEEPASIPLSSHHRVRDSKLATSIPLYTRFRTRDGPIVGTTLDYFGFRELQLVEGRQIAMLGECVIGNRLARSRGLRVGDSLLSSAEDIFDLAGVYPLKMRIVGILGSNHSADDMAAFVDLKTTWIIEGLGHGHQSLNRPDATDGILSKDGNEIVANASIIQYNEITEENAGTFHFHGEMSSFPITSVIAVPNSQKANAILQGRFVGGADNLQVVRPTTVMGDLQGTIFAVSRYVTLAIVLVGCIALAMMVLVITLSLQLRHRELETMAKVGAPRHKLIAIVATEILSVLLLGSGIAIVAGVASSQFTDSAIRFVLGSP